MDIDPGPLPRVPTRPYAKAGKTTTEWQLTEYDPPTSFAWKLIEGPFRGRGGYQLVSMTTARGSPS